MKKQPIKRIHVNQHNIRANAKNGNEDLPVFSIKVGKHNIKCHSVHIRGPSVLRYSPDKPLSCGAKVWVETRSDVIFVNTTAFLNDTNLPSTEEPILPGVGVQ